MAALTISTGVATASETCPNETLRTGLSARLPDCRAYEQVSPINKEGAAIRPTYNEQGLLFKAAQDGRRVFYAADSSLPGSLAGGQTFYLGSGAPEWATEALSPPNLLETTAQSGPYGVTGEYRWLSEDLSCQIIKSIEPLTPDTPAVDAQTETPNLYRRNADGTYTLLTNTVPLNPGSGELSGVYVVMGASSDCKKVIFSSTYEFTSNGSDQLYEWDNGALRVVGVLPDGSPPLSGVEPLLGANEGPASNMVSPNGSRVLFVANGLVNGQIFMRENNGTGAARTVEVAGAAGGRFEGASRNDSRVFFTSAYGEAPGASSKGAESCNHGNIFENTHGCDLYEYNAETEQRTDLSADGNEADATGADVAGVLDASEDGSYVYFAAVGQLTPASGDASENTEEENEVNEELNLYLTHAGQLTFVSRVSKKDLFGEEVRDLAADPRVWSSRATPDGANLLFVSRAHLSGYDNSDAVTGTPDPEVYVFSRDTGSTVCASCNPSGARPVSKTESGSPVETALIPVSTAFGGDILGDTPHVFSEDGSRVFFESPDQLSPLTKGGEVNAYEWERTGHGSCSVGSGTYSPDAGGCIYLLDSGLPANQSVQPAKFVDASTSGDDVFLQSASKLLEQDKDNVEDLYDARVNGGNPAPAPFTACEGEACQGLAAGSPTFGTPSSASFSAGEQPTGSKPKVKPRSLTRAQKLARALKVCQSKKNKHRREACRRQAKKQYGASLSRKALRRGVKG
ncbi:MAG TPA: hypothetical protein VK781_06235 [Solirubrobacteraceae bacterium]|nr:hypothetical protein [Solirubrobacteraceae bacterium]